MPKIRIYDLAKKINIESKELLSKLKEFGISDKVHSSSIDDDLANRLSDAFKAKVRTQNISQEGQGQQGMNQQAKENQENIKKQQIKNQQTQQAQQDQNAQNMTAKPIQQNQPVAAPQQPAQNLQAMSSSQPIPVPVDRQTKTQTQNPQRQNQSQGQGQSQGQQQGQRRQGSQMQGQQPHGQGQTQGQGQRQGQQVQGQGQRQMQGQRPVGQTHSQGQNQQQGQRQGQHGQGGQMQGNQGQNQGQHQAQHQTTQHQTQGQHQGQGYSAQGQRQQGQRRPNENSGQGGYTNSNQGQRQNDMRRQGQPGQQGQTQGQGQGQSHGQSQSQSQNRPYQNRTDHREFREAGQEGNRENRSYGSQGTDRRQQRPQGSGQQGQSYGQGQGGGQRQGQQGQGQRQGGYQGQRPQGEGGPRSQDQQGYRQGSRDQKPEGQGYRQNKPEGQGFKGKDDGFRAKDKDDNYGSKPGQKPAQGNRSPGARNGQRPGGSKLQVLQPVREEIDLNRRKRDEKHKDMKEQPEKQGKAKNGKIEVPKKAEVKKPEPPKREPIHPSLPVQLPPVMTVKELAEILKKSGSDIIKIFMNQGKLLTLNQEIDYETAANVCMHYEYDFEPIKEIDILEEAFKEEEETDEMKLERPPVVVVMGHVDHGKTSLLDSIRQTSVTTTEAGGITQHIGAYTVSIDDKPITFLDTPGHEAFTAMRMRGAQVTDIAVLVVAADDGVMPQTIEAINHAKAANVDIIVAINKIDKPNANPDRVKQELTEHGILVEDWGGDIISAPVSAVKKTGIDHLLEMIILVAEMKELKANPNKRARGTVIEALLDKGRGPVATVLVQDGTLQVGDYVVAGGAHGRIRAMMDDKGLSVKKAGPSMPVEILGLSEVPRAGDAFNVAVSDKQARSVADSLASKSREELLKSTPQKVSLDDLFSQIQAGNVKDLNIVVKADVQGSAEAVKTSLERLSNAEVRIRIIHSGVGAITETDVMLASASNAIIIGFNVRPEAASKNVAELEKVDIRLYRIIYNAIEDISAAMKGMLDPVYKEKVIGHAEIRKLFKASGIGTIAGAYITDGKFLRHTSVRIIRDSKVVYEGSLDTLKRFKDDVKEVNSGYECGLLFNKFNDVKEGDKVEAFMMEEVER